LKSIDRADRPATGEPLKALIFDVDGTLYEQGPVRRAMLFRLVRAHLTSPRQGWLTFEALQAYRNAQEMLRTTGHKSDDIASTQLLLAAEQVGARVEIISSFVARWMEQEPLSVVASAVRKGILEFLRNAKRHGLLLAVYSDYPADRKLAAMGMAEFFDVAVTAQDRGIQRFKPDPTGLEVTLRRLGARNNEAIYIGDRPDVDAVAASRAGMRYFILDKTHTVDQLAQFVIPRS
jgi:phosphoglycolate phosphatase/putative hydrolase of the HAD superfamily